MKDDRQAPVEAAHQTGASNTLAAVTLDAALSSGLSPETAHERDIAIFALLEENEFCLEPAKPDGPARPGPYLLHLGLNGQRLLLHISDEDGHILDELCLSLRPFRQVLRDYRLVFDSYHSAIKSAAPARIEAIDMGRRGLHDEGSRILIEALEGRIKLDFATSRRLFTLLYALQWQGSPM